MSVLKHRSEAFDWNIRSIFLVKSSHAESGETLALDLSKGQGKPACPLSSSVRQKTNKKKTMAFYF